MGGSNSLSADSVSQRTCEPNIAKKLDILTHHITGSEHCYAASLGHGGQASATYGRQCIDPASL